MVFLLGKSSGLTLSSASHSFCRKSAGMIFSVPLKREMANISVKGPGSK